MISDNGVGLPEEIDFRNTNTLGLQLVLSLVEQIDGTITTSQKDGKGCAYIVTFRSDT